MVWEMVWQDVTYSQKHMRDGARCIIRDQGHVELDIERDSEGDSRADLFWTATSSNKALWYGLEVGVWKGNKMVVMWYGVWIGS